MKQILNTAFAAILLVFALGCEEKNPQPDKADSLVFTATISAAGQEEVFKRTWNADDAVCFFGVSGGAVTSETLVPSELSQDGITAKFKATGRLKSDNGVYYAYVAGTGVNGFNEEGWTTMSMDRTSIQTPTAMIAKTLSGSVSMEFKSVFSLLKVSVTGVEAAYLSLEGKNGEIVDRESLISRNDLSVKGLSEGTTVLTKEMNGSGDYYFTLYNGMDLKDGYVVKARDKSGKVLAKSESSERLTVVNGGMMYVAPELVSRVEKNDVFDPSRIILSMAMVSDVHIDKNTAVPTQKFKSALSQLKSQALKDDSDGLDAVLVDGDLTQNPANGQSNYVEVDEFRNAYESVLNPSLVPMIYTVGNHDTYKWWTSDTYKEALNIGQRLGSTYFTSDQDKTMLEQFQCRHCKVGSCNILCVTPWSLSPVTYSPNVVQWLDDKLKAVTSEDPDHYIIVMTHPMIYNTVYGSLLGNYWYTDYLTETLRKYPQVIVFGGHLHFPINDPRSIWQGEFTSVGCGSVRYMAIENGGYDDMKSATVMKDCDDVSTGHLLQIDESGNMRITRMFFSQSTTFGDPWTLKYPQTDRSHLTAYTSEARKAANRAPSLSSLEVKVTPVNSTSSLATASFASGSDDEFVHHYILKLRKDGSEMVTRKILADFYRCARPSQMKSSWEVNLGYLSNGEYELSLTAYDSWDETSNTLTKLFRVEGEAPKAAEVYADIDFNSGEITDSKGKLEISNNGASVGQVTLVHNAKAASLDAVTIKSNQQVNCRFKQIANSQDMIQFAAKGFSVEAWYVDKEPGGAVHGVVCGTEYGGWGLATAAGDNKGKPYFVVGYGSSNTYAYIYAKSAASAEELVHVVGVYDAASGLARLYVNGEFQDSKSISGTFFPATGSDFNAFCLGNDVGPSTFPSSNLVIADVKIYSGALTEAEVKAAYAKSAASVK